MSTNFNVDDLLRKMVRECNPHKELANLDVNELHKELQEKLDGKRFLLVLDDLWNENRHERLKLEGFLTKRCRGE